MNKKHIQFYYRGWFVFLLVIMFIGLFFGVFFLSDYTTKIEFVYKNLSHLRKQDVADQQKNELSLGFTDGRPTLGDPSAPVHIVEFSDFQCPFCKEAAVVFQDVLPKYIDDIYYQYRHFPLVSVHPNAQSAAMASMCAYDQEAFWEYHDILFANQLSLSDENLVAYATRLGLNMDEFTPCFKSGKYADEIQEDMGDALRLGVSATPTFFINGELIKGVFPKEVWEKIIRDLR